MLPRRTALPLAALALIPALLRGQPIAAPPPLPVAHEPLTAGPLEDYLRLAQLLDTARSALPWTIRPFAPATLAHLAPDGASPWGSRYDLRDDPGSRLPVVRLLRPATRFTYNSAFPYGVQDGAVWAGRGLTSAVTLGVSLRWGPLTVVAAPTLFRAENAEFPLAFNGAAADERWRFASAWYTPYIDRPQRFGSGAYARADWGQSTARLDLFGVAAGVSTANETWGPASRFPFILGANAPGVPRMFLGTSRPLPVGIGRISGRVAYGYLAQSEYMAPPPPPGAFRETPRRIMSSVSLVLQPRGLDGLEVGAGRFFHSPDLPGGLRDFRFRTPFAGALKRRLEPDDNGVPGNADNANQLASIWARWRLPRSGFEAFFEVGREDHAWDEDHLLLSPDNTTAIGAGLQKGWRRGDAWWSARAEVLDHLGATTNRRLGDQPFYVHFDMRQGHTHRGQLLGADAGVGAGAAGMLRVERYARDGRWAVTGTRTIRSDRGRGFFTLPVGNPIEGTIDVLYALGVERLLFRGWADLSLEGTLLHNFDRDGLGDRTGVNVGVAITPTLRR